VAKRSGRAGVGKKGKRERKEKGNGKGMRDGMEGEAQNVSS